MSNACLSVNLKKLHKLNTNPKISSPTRNVDLFSCASTDTRYYYTLCAYRTPFTVFFWSRKIVQVLSTGTRIIGTGIPPACFVHHADGFSHRRGTLEIVWEALASVSRANVALHRRAVSAGNRRIYFYTRRRVRGRLCVHEFECNPYIHTHTHVCSKSSW